MSGDTNSTTQPLASDVPMTSDEQKFWEDIAKEVEEMSNPNKPEDFS